MIEAIEIVRIMPTAIWVESDFFGARHVVLQHEGCEPFTYASFHYDYRYTSNSGTHHAAESLARSLGATDPIDHRDRPLERPTEESVREQIAELQEYLDEKAGGTTTATKGPKT